MIKESAIQRKADGRVWTGRRHNDVIRTIIKEGEHDCCTRDKFTQGFVTDDGKFVGRREAYLIALDCGQIMPSNDSEAVLISEDLY